MSAVIFNRSSVLSVAATLVLAACTKPEAPPPSTALEGALDIVAWAGYIERGAVDKDYDWVTPFEAETGCKVNVIPAGTADEMVLQIASGGHDLVTASGDAALRLIRERKVVALDLARVPGYASVDARLQRAAWHYVDGAHYGVPYLWGPNLLLYDAAAFGKRPPTSWSVVFEPQTLADGKSNQQRVQGYDAPIYIADAALYLMAKQPALGIEDPYALSVPQYQAALNVLRAQRPLVHRYWRDASVQMQDFSREGVVAAPSRAFQSNVLIDSGKNFAAVMPQEGATGWADTFMLSARARHPNCAYRWLEWSLKPKVQGDAAAWVGGNPAVPAACDGNALLGPEGCKANGYEHFAKLHFWRTPESKCEQHAQGCVPYRQWMRDYRDIIREWSGPPAG